MSKGDCQTQNPVSFWILILMADRGEKRSFVCLEQCSTSSPDTQIVSYALYFHSLSPPLLRSYESSFHYLQYDFCTIKKFQILSWPSFPFSGNPCLHGLSIQVGRSHLLPPICIPEQATNCTLCFTTTANRRKGKGREGSLTSRPCQESKE